jgi:hypothetical protein
MKSMTEEEKKGYAFTKGACAYLVKIFLLGIFIFGLLFIVLNTFHMGVDDTDLNGWNRSGLKLHTDYKSGIQYLSTPNGSLTPRLSKEGNLMILQTSSMTFK